jgi:hypothetical protein
MSPCYNDGLSGRPFGQRLRMVFDNCRNARTEAGKLFREEMFAYLLGILVRRLTFVGF